MGGEAIVGALTGSRLQPLASTTMPWGRWKELHPDTLLNSGSKKEDEAMFAAPRYGNGFSSGYQDRINDGQFAFPVDAERLDGRLSAGEIVLNVENEGEAKVFPLLDRW